MSDWSLPAVIAPQPPHNLEVEQGLLGAILLNNDAIGRALVTGLAADDFFEPLHQAIYAETLRQHALGQKVTPVTLKQTFPDIEITPGLRFGQYLAQLAIDATAMMTVPDYAVLTRNLAITRQLLAAGHELGSARASNISPDQALRAAFETVDLARLRMTDSVRNLSSDADEGFAMIVDRANALRCGEMEDDGVMTGLTELDKATYGLKPGELIVVAGRPGMGKTTVAGSIARLQAMPFQDPATGEILVNPIGFFSLEMPATQMWARILADHARTRKYQIDYRDILRPRDGEEDNLSDAKMNHLMEVKYSKLRPALMMDFSSGPSLGELVAKVRQMKRRALADYKRPLKVVWIDYLKFIRAADRYSGNRNNEIGQITAGLKLLARDEDIAIVLLCQLNRKVEERADKRPELQDLRDSGEIEADADAVWFLYREAYYLQKGGKHNADKLIEYEACKYHIEIEIAKQRMGPTGVVKLFCDVATCSIRNLDSVEGL